jgi:molecular chaperone GrpE
VEAAASAPAGQRAATPEAGTPEANAAVAAAEPAKTEPGTGRHPERDEDEESRPTVVVRDRRKVKDPGKAEPGAAEPTATASTAGAASAGAQAPAEPAADPAVTPGETETETEVEPVTGEPVTVAAEAEPGGPGAFGAELEALRSDIDELTRDLQRITAEYANYRKRVDRDRGLVAEQATGVVLAALLPVLDDIDRAREHGDLVGPFGTVAEQLTNALTKFGLTPFGEKGDPFDPTRHEAVAHQTSTEVTEPTCVDIMRRGYLLGDRLLRPALVGVADPE